MLRLAENKPDINILEYYVPIPDNAGNPVLMREDVLDDLTDDQFNAYIDLLEHSGMGTSAKKKARQERRAQRKATKQENKEAAVQNKEGRAAIKFAKAGALTGLTPGAGIPDTSAAGQKTTSGKDKTIYYILGGAAGLVVLYMLTRKKKPGAKRRR